MPPSGRLEEATLNLAACYEVSTVLQIHMGSMGTFRPARSEENILIFNLDTKNEDGWKMGYHVADALCMVKMSKEGCAGFLLYLLN